MDTVPVSAGSVPAPALAPAGWTTVATLAPDSGPTSPSLPRYRFIASSWGPLAAVAASDHSRYAIGSVAVVDRAGLRSGHGLGPVAVATDGRMMVIRGVRRDRVDAEPNDSPYGARFLFPRQLLRGAKGAIEARATSAETFPPVDDIARRIARELESHRMIRVNVGKLRACLDALGDVETVTLAVPAPKSGDSFASKPLALFGYARDYRRAEGPEPVRQSGRGSRSRVKSSDAEDLVAALSVLMPIDVANQARAVGDLATLAENLATSSGLR